MVTDWKALVRCQTAKRHIWGNTCQPQIISRYNNYISVHWPTVVNSSLWMDGSSNSVLLFWRCLTLTILSHGTNSVCPIMAAEITPASWPLTLNITQLNKPVFISANLGFPNIVRPHAPGKMATPCFHFTPEWFTLILFLKGVMSYRLFSAFCSNPLLSP